ncbi:hypothetical protein WA026_018470 [Henosepilachna vigintioctopunctata]|uniref:Uncharacterized protein n=1 Tax=Henosepilachna vigintioctopunctata TaxID=420089 RepID=A0AAW1V205_9CUCU
MPVPFTRRQLTQHTWSQESPQEAAVLYFPASTNSEVQRKTTLYLRAHISPVIVLDSDSVGSVGWLLAYEDVILHKPYIFLQGNAAVSSNPLHNSS